MSNIRELSQLASVINVNDENKNVGIGTTTPKTALNVVGVVSATSFYGDGSNLTGISASGGNSQWVTTAAGIHTLSNVGIGTTNPNVGVTSTNTAVLAIGIVSAYKFYGDGSDLTGISATGGGGASFVYDSTVFAYQNVIDSNITVAQPYKSSAIYADVDVTVDIEPGFQLSIDDGCVLNIINL